MTKYARTILVALLCGLLAAIAATSAAAVPGLQSVAHRGDKEHHPDNSIDAIESAIDKGADWIEIDVIYNPDGDTFFLSHDNVCTGAGGSANIDQDSYTKVRTRCLLPELGAVLDAYAGRGKFIVEFKSTDRTATTGPAKLAALLKAKKLESSSWVSSLTDSALTQIKNSGSAVNLMRVRAWSAFLPVSESWLAQTARMGFQGANVNIGAWTAPRVGQAKSLGLVTVGWAWPTASEKDNATALELGLRMFMTDRLDDLHTKLGRMEGTP